MTDSPFIAIDTCASGEHVRLVLVNPSIIEYNGELAPGLSLTVPAAMQLAADLLGHAAAALLSRDGEADDE